MQYVYLRNKSASYVMKIKYLKYLTGKCIGINSRIWYTFTSSLHFIRDLCQAEYIVFHLFCIQGKLFYITS